MKSLNDCRFACLFTQSGMMTSVPDAIFEAAYLEFVDLLYVYAASGLDYDQKYRQLTHLHAGFSVLLIPEAQPSELKKNPQYIRYATLALRVVEAELELLEKRIQCPRLFDPPSLPTTTLLWKAPLADLVELAAALCYSERIVGADQRLVSFLGLISWFEGVFRVKIPRPYDERGRNAVRKKGTTPFLDQLKLLLQTNAEK